MSSKIKYGIGVVVALALIAPMVKSITADHGGSARQVASQMDTQWSNYACSSARTDLELLTIQVADATKEYTSGATTAEELSSLQQKLLAAQKSAEEKCL